MNKIRIFGLRENTPLEYGESEMESSFDVIGSSFDIVLDIVSRIDSMDIDQKFGRNEMSFFDVYSEDGGYSGDIANPSTEPSNLGVDISLSFDASGYVEPIYFDQMVNEVHSIMSNYLTVTPIRKDKV